MKAGRGAAALCFFLLLPAGPLAAEEPAPERKTVIEAGMSASPALAVFSRYFIASFSPADVSVFLRWFDLAETTVRVHFLSGEQLSGPPLVGVEAALAPSLGSYRPAIGIGVLFASVSTFYLDLSVPGGEISIYGLCAPLRWAWPMGGLPPDGPVAGSVSLSFLELRFGSIVPLGTSPSFENLGNFYFEAVLVAAGFSFVLLRE